MNLIKKIDLSVVIPCYNEEKILPETIKALEKFFFKHRDIFDYEICFVDDGSTDLTKHTIQSFMKQNKKIKLFDYDYNMGKGFAVRLGIDVASYKNILILDADLSVRPEEVLKAMKELRDGKEILIVGQRIQKEKQPFYRIVAGKAFSLLQKIIINTGIVDTQCPFKLLININYIHHLLSVDGFAYDCELIYKAQKRNIEIKWIYVDYFNNVDTRVTILKTISMFFELLKIRFSHHHRQR